MAHQGTRRSIIITLSTTRQTHHNGCKIWLYQWISAVQGHQTTDEEEGAPSEEEEANMGNIIINLPTASRIMQ